MLLTGVQLSGLSLFAGASSFPENAFWMFELWQNIYYDIQTSFFSFPPYKILPFISIQFNRISAQKNQLFL